MNKPFETVRRVEFRDTDAAGIVHFSVFFTYMEQAEHDLLRHLGTTVIERDGETMYSWPRVSAACDFRSMAKFEDPLNVAVWVAHLGTKSVRYRFRFSCGERLVAEGTTVAVYCRVAGHANMTGLPIPDHLRSALQKYLIPDPA